MQTNISDKISFRYILVINITDNYYSLTTHKKILIIRPTYFIEQENGMKIYNVKKNRIKDIVVRYFY